MEPELSSGDRLPSHTQHRATGKRTCHLWNPTVRQNVYADRCLGCAVYFVNVNIAPEERNKFGRLILNSYLPKYRSSLMEEGFI